MPIKFCFDEVYSAKDSLNIRISLANRSRPLFNYWLAMCCLLAPDKMVELGANELSGGEGPFVYAVELHFVMTEWCREHSDESIVAISPQVLNALRQRRAIMMVSFAHEGRCHYESGSEWSESSIFDALKKTAEEYDLESEQLWFVTGNLLADDEEKAWIADRGLKKSPFTLRSCELSSFGLGNAIRESIQHGRGPVAVPLFQAKEPHRGWQQLKIGWSKREYSGYRIGEEWEVPRWRYACLNRQLRHHRWWVLERLFRENLLQYGKVTFPRMTESDLAIVGYEPIPLDLLPLVESLPISHEDRWVTESSREFLAQNTYAVTATLPEVVRQSAVEIVNETFYAEGRLVTEKTFKALTGRGPVVVVGSQGTLEYLRSIGVETWSDVIDEAYDQVGSPNDPTGDRGRFEACMDAVIPIISSESESAKVAFACRRQSTSNLRWLIEASKPWDHLLEELEQVLASL